MSIIAIILTAVAAIVAAWNFYPPLREKLKGWSTIAEGFIGTTLYYFGAVSEALKEGQAAGYVPENLEQYVPMVLFAWVVLKRFQTKTPVGSQ